MSPNHNQSSRITAWRKKAGLLLVLAPLGLLVVGCGSNGPSAVDPKYSAIRPVREPSVKATSRFVLGHPQPGLNFKVAITPESVPEVTTPTTILGPSNLDPTHVALVFGEAIVAGDDSRAFRLLSQSDRNQIGSPTKLAELLARDPKWISVSLGSPSPEDAQGVRLVVKQTPMIDEIHGVVAPTATVNFATVQEGGGPRLLWRRRRITQNYTAPESRLQTDIMAWAQDRRTCTTASGAASSRQYGGGLVGDAGLAEALCHSKDSPVVNVQGDVYALDDPQPLLNAFGSGVYQWARVATVSAGKPMNVIAAPLGDHWIVVGVAPSGAADK